MNRSRAAALIVGLALALVSPDVALAQACGEVGINPSPGWQGATITIVGTGFTPNTPIYVNFGGVQIGSTTSNGEGAFSVAFTIPGDFPVGPTNVFVQDDPANCSANPGYDVAGAPTTTTAATTTTSAAPSTTVSSTATTATTIVSTNDDAPTTTTTEPVANTSTTAPNDKAQGSSPIVLVLLGALAGAGLLFLGISLGRRNRD